MGMPLGSNATDFFWKMDLSNGNTLMQPCEA